MSTEEAKRSNCVVKLEKLDLSSFFSQHKVQMLDDSEDSPSDDGARAQTSGRMARKSSSSKGTPSSKARSPAAKGKAAQPKVSAVVDTNLAQVAKPGSVFVVKDSSGKQFQVMTTGTVSGKDLKKQASGKEQPKEINPFLRVEETSLSGEGLNKQVNLESVVQKEIIPFHIIKELLEGYKEYLCTTTSHQPAGGKVFIYDKDVMGETWSDDGYEWCMHTPDNRIPKSTPTVKHTVEHIKSTAHPEGHWNFRRLTYSLISRPNILLVHYKGHLFYKTHQKGRGRKRKSDCSPEKGNMDEDGPKENLHLDIDQAIEYLQNYKGKLSNQIPQFPKGGEVYLFNTNKFAKRSWMADGYIWKNNGSRYMPKENPVLKKRFFTIKPCSVSVESSARFVKGTYNLIERPHIVLAHYGGDHTVYKIRPHGNNKRPKAEPYFSHKDVQLLKSDSAHKKSVRKMFKTASQLETPGTSALDESGNADEAGRNSPPPVGDNTGGDDSDNDAGPADLDDEEAEQLPEQEPEPAWTPPDPIVRTGPHEALSCDVAIRLLNQFAEHQCLPPTKYPRAGEAFLFNTNLPKVDPLWKTDGYIWHKLHSSTYYPREKPMLGKKIYTLSHPQYPSGCKLFVKHVFHFLDPDNLKLVHYVGDENVAEDSSKIHEQRLDSFHRRPSACHIPAVASPRKRAGTSSKTVTAKRRRNDSDHTDPVNPPDSFDPISSPNQSPQVTQMQVEVLEQQKRNLKLQEAKLLLEIRKLEEGTKELSSILGSKAVGVPGGGAPVPKDIGPQGNVTVTPVSSKSNVKVSRIQRPYPSQTIVRAAGDSVSLTDSQQGHQFTSHGESPDKVVRITPHQYTGPRMAVPAGAIIRHTGTSQASQSTVQGNLVVNLPQTVVQDHMAAQVVVEGGLEQHHRDGNVLYM